MTERVSRMMDSTPQYYQFSTVFEAIQTAQGDEYDSQEAKNEDLRLQLYIMTATWGLLYWEEVLGLPTNLAESYSIRRSKVLSLWRGVGNFSAELIKTVCESFSNGEVDVIVDIPGLAITVKFVGTMGIPPNMGDLEAVIDNLIHAHLGVGYTFTYLVYDVLKATLKTYDELKATLKTNESLKTWDVTTWV